MPGPVSERSKGPNSKTPYVPTWMEDLNDLNEEIEVKERDKVPENLIDKPYAYHKPSVDGLDRINKLRAHFSEGERLIKEICPASRQASLAITNNEQTAMWAIKAVVFNDPDSIVE